ncbi:MAG: AHH domain-containing protein [Thermodesulfobacteriota bacterium]
MNKHKKKIALSILILFLINQFSVVSAGCWIPLKNSPCKVWFDEYTTRDGKDCGEPSYEFEWEGGCFDNYAHGPGVLKTYRSGTHINTEATELYYGSINKQSIQKVGEDEYIGETNRGSLDGNGILIKHDGRKYIGGFNESLPHGKLSEYIGEQILYDGQWINGKKEGSGTIYYSNGIRYEGPVLDGKPHGEGLRYEDGNVVTSGTWDYGVLNGPVTINYPDGKKVETTFTNDIRGAEVVIYYPNYDKYEGVINEEGQKSGPGKYYYANGDLYVGAWASDTPDGLGKLIFKDGTTLEGVWKNGQLTENDKNLIIYENNEKYLGSLKNGIRCGRGTLYYSNGNKYEGEWSDNEKNGEGTFHFSDGGTYTGSWLKGKKNGSGRYDLPTGAFYEGNWVDDERSGLGVFVFRGGSKFEGQWANDKRNGHGKLQTVSGAEYEGDWKDDKINGKGKMSLPDGEYYDGEWIDNKKNGKGVYYWKDGSAYIGDWQDDLPHGGGNFFWINGDVYDGEWESGLPNGEGTLFYENGDHYEGSWVDGSKEGEGTYVFENGNIYKGFFLNGQPNGFGTFIFTNDSFYEGSFKEGRFNGEGSLHIWQDDSYVIYTSLWDGSEKLPKHGSILFENGDLFEGEIEEDGAPTANGVWSTDEERQDSVEPDNAKPVQSQLQEDKPQQEASRIRRANEFYKKHESTISTAVNVVSLVLTVASFFPATAPVAVPALMALNIADAAITTTSKSIDAYDAYKEGDREKIKEAGSDLIVEVGVNVLFIYAPKFVKKGVKKFSEKHLKEATSELLGKALSKVLRGAKAPLRRKIKKEIKEGFEGVRDLARMQFCPPGKSCGKIFNEQYQCHHIVAQGEPEAEPARIILETYGIDVKNDACNKVCLPHSGPHSSQYYAFVNMCINEAAKKAAGKKDGRNEIFKALLKLRIGLIAKEILLYNK